MTLFSALAGVAVAAVSYPDQIDPDELTAEERAIFTAIPIDREKLRLEFCCGRLAAHGAMRALGLPIAPVLRDPEGRPITPAAQIAITHGLTLAAAAASIVLHVGIDVVDPSDQTRLERIRARVLRGPEPELADAHPQDGLRLIWAAREAIAKATHTGMFVFGLTKVHVTAIDRSARRMTCNRSGIELMWIDLPDGEILVVAAASDAAADAARAECA